MVIRTLLIIILFHIKAVFAINGTITVLEAPIFSIQDEKSPVVQYYRKGATIYLHPQEAFVDRYEEEDLSLVEGITADKNDDPFIGNKDLYYPDPESKFYKTVSKNGKAAFILKEHVIIDFKDKREFTRKIIKHDHTDYRIQEPLPDKYPLIYEQGFRGLTQVAVGVPNYTPYPYNSSIKNTEYDLSKEFNFVWSRLERTNKERRFFFGAMGGFHFSSIKYLLDDQTANQENFRFSIGPYTSYDIYRTKKNAFNMYLSIQYNFLDQMKISIADSSDEAKEERLYKTNLSFSQILGFNYQYFKAMHNFDAIIGVNLKNNLPKTYTAVSTAGNTSFWKSTAKTDSYRQDFTSEISLYIGLQSFY